MVAPSGRDGSSYKYHTHHRSHNSDTRISANYYIDCNAVISSFYATDTDDYADTNNDRSADSLVVYATVFTDTLQPPVVLPSSRQQW